MELIWTIVGCLLLLLTVSIFLYDRSNVGTAVSAPVTSINRTQVNTNSTVTSTVPTTSDNELSLISDSNIQIYLDNLVTDVRYFVKSKESDQGLRDMHYINGGGKDGYYDYPIVFGGIDPKFGTYTEYLRDVPVPEVFPNGDLLVHTATTTFSIWSAQSHAYSRHFTLSVPSVPTKNYCGAELSPLEQPVLSPDGKMFEVLSAVVCGHDYSQTLFLVNIETGLIESYLVPQGDKVFKGDMSGPGKWHTEKYISFPSGYPKDCSGWPDGARFYLSNKKFTQGEKISDAYVSPDNEYVVTPSKSNLPFKRFNDGMCENISYGSFSMKNHGVSKIIYDKRNDPVDVGAFRWLSNSKLMFTSTMYELSTSTTYDEDNKGMVVTDAGDELYETYFLYDLDSDKLYGATTTPEFIAILRDHGFVADAFTITTLSYRTKDAATWHRYNENVLVHGGQSVFLPGGNLRFLGYENAFEFINNNTETSNTDCSKVNCREYFKKFREIRKIGQ